MLLAYLDGPLWCTLSYTEDALGAELARVRAELLVDDVDRDDMLGERVGVLVPHGCG